MVDSHALIPSPAEQELALLRAKLQELGVALPTPEVVVDDLDAAFSALDAALARDVTSPNASHEIVRLLAKILNMTVRKTPEGA